MERRTRQRQGARWQTKEKRERRGAQRAQGEEGGKGPAASGGHPGPAGKGKFQGSKKGKRPIGAHLGREISISRVICAPGKLGTPGESGHVPPPPPAPGLAGVGVVFLAIKVWPFLVPPQEDQNPARLCTPSPGGSTERHRAEAIRERFSWLEQGLLWGGRDPRAEGVPRGARRSGCPHAWSQRPQERA